MFFFIIILWEFGACKVHSVNVFKVFIIITMTRNLHKKTKKRDCHVNFRLELSKPPLCCIIRVIKTISDCQAGVLLYGGESLQLLAYNS